MEVKCGIVKQPTTTAPLSVAGPAQTVGDLLQARAREAGDAVCIGSIAGDMLIWRRLARHIDSTKVMLRALGIGPEDRVAVVMSNGPVLAGAFLAIASAAPCAPLNPAYGVDEFVFYLGDLKARALVVSQDAPAAAVEAARQLAVPLVEAVPDLSGPGLFNLRGSAGRAASTDRELQSEDIALLLHTSGTTSRPKLVPLRHRNLTASAHNMVKALQLSADDRCLNLMPLFHIHGLIGGLLAPLAAGGSVICPPSFRPGVFFDWLDATHPSWYTAVPTMHRTIAAEAAGRDLAGCPLRFIRSSSSPLPTKLYDDLSRAFGVPVIEAYSMTEAAHQMTCNPIERGRQKPGTVGMPAGPDVAILDAQGRVLRAGETGEIAIRGPSVMDGYVGSPQANDEAFVNGWFRTGDQGHFDDDGYLNLTGRLKEQINRGGEKVSPLEIDQVLLRHPDVVEAVTFGFPHPTLGEEVAAAVVLCPQSGITADQLQAFARDFMAPFKIPKRILIMDKIPKGPTGKVQRRPMAALLGMGITKPVMPEQPASRIEELESELLALWRQTIGSEAIGLDDDFFESGGDSLMALEIILKLEKSMGEILPESMLLDHSTVRRLARGLLQQSGMAADPIVPVQPNGTLPPIFFFHGDRTGGYYTRRLAHLLGPDQPFFSIAPHGPDAALWSIEEMAEDRLPSLLAMHPKGSFMLAGYCNGGMVAFEVARRLTAAGRPVGLLAIIDAPPLNFRPSIRTVARLAEIFASGAGRTSISSLLSGIADIAWRQLCNFQQNSIKAYFFDGIVLGLLRRARAGFGVAAGKDIRLAGGTARLREELFKRDLVNARMYNRVLRRYLPGRINFPVVYYSAIYRYVALRHVGSNCEFVPVPGGHWGCVTTHAEVLVEDWRARLQRARKHDSQS